MLDMTFSVTVCVLSVGFFFLFFLRNKLFKLFPSQNNFSTEFVLSLEVAEEALDAPPLEAFKARSDMAMGCLPWWRETSPQPGSRNR